MRKHYDKAVGTVIAPALRGGTMGGIAAALFTCLLASSAQAHFILQKPEASQKQDDSGGPQKVGPCGGPGFGEPAVEASGKSNEFHAGETVHFEWEIAVPHDGYFRIALAEDPSEFVDPVFTDGTACTYEDSSVQTGAHGNVLLDGIDPTATSQDVVLPNMPCEKCTLQVIQVMRNHGPPNCIYYHCADVTILPAAGGSDAGVGTGGMGAGTGGMMGSGGMTGMVATGGKGAAGSGGMSAGSGGKGAAGSGGATTAAGSGGATATGSGGGGAMVLTPPAEKDDGGCAVATPGSRASSALVSSMLGLGVIGLGWRRRRRR